MIVCITGMHRSGTSMVARLLNVCGVYLGEEKDLIPAKEDNPEGYWENAHFIDINNEILYRLNGAWDYPPHLEDEEWVYRPEFHSIRIKAAQLVNEMMPQTVWGWKDPRNSLTFPFWKTLIPNLKAVVCVRNPFEVQRSLAKRGYSSGLFGFNLWMEYNNSILDFIPFENRIITHYESYFFNAQQELARVLDFLGMDVDPQVIEAACRDAKLSLRHHQATSEELFKHAARDVIETYTKLCTHAGPVFHASLQQELSAASSPQEQAPLRVLIELNAEMQSLRKSLNEKESALQRANATLVEIYNSRTWRISRRIQAARVLFFPVGSRREKTLFAILWFVRKFFFDPLRKIYFVTLRSREILRTDGWRAYLNRIRARFNSKNLVVEEPDDHANTSIDLQLYNKDVYAKAYRSYLSVASVKTPEDYVALDESDQIDSKSLVKLIAFYLPQFHPIPENDAWWGRGFTEWTNVSKATPQFFGHYQPHIPGELGFYDLRLPEVQERQVELARKYGVYGFAFHYYWFGGKRLLEKPLENYLNNPKIDFPFCVCWANENWTRRWDGLDNEILIAQDHTAENDLGFIHDLAPILKDPRYIRIHGRPIIIIYRVQLLSQPAATAKGWREYCRENGLGDPYLVAVQAFGFNDAREIGFDAMIEFPPLNMTPPPVSVNPAMKILNLQYKGKIYRYQDAVRSFGYRKLSDSKLFRGVFPNWDNEARKPGRGFSFAFATPYAYQRWLGQVGQETINTEPDPEKRLIFINAWNEWAEGAHLEPDRRYGYAYLKATADALRDLGENDPRLAEEEYLFGRPIQKRHDTAVFLHLFYPELWDELCLYLNNLQGQFDLFVSIPDVVKIETQQFLDYHKDTYIFRCENRGRDISPFLRMFRAVTRHGYVQALKLHTKKSKHREDGDKWRADLYHKLMGSPEIVQKILNTFKQDHVRKVGIIAPEGHVVSSEYYLASNKENIARLARLANLPYSGDEFRFVGGSMFWFRMESLFLLSLLPLTNDNFEPEAGQVDGTLAHAMERFFGLLMAMTNHKLFVSNGQFVYPYETSFPPEVYAHARPHLAD